MNVPRLFVVGAAAIDVKAQSHGALVHRADVPGRVGVTMGGVARNVAKNLALLGANVTCMSVTGDDPFGRMLRDDLARTGVNVDDFMIGDRPTATWVGVLDGQGDLEVGVFGGEILTRLTPEIIQVHATEIAAADLVALDATLPRPTVDAVVQIARAHGVPRYLNPASVARATTVVDCIGSFELVTANALEAQILTGRTVSTLLDAAEAARTLIRRGVQRAIVTLGPDGIVYADSTGILHKPALTAKVVDTTGAGDALAAIFLLCHLQELALEETLDRCLRAAALTVACSESVSELIGNEKRA